MARTPPERASKREREVSTLWLIILKRYIISSRIARQVGGRHTHLARPGPCFSHNTCPTIISSIKNTGEEHPFPFLGPWTSVTHPLSPKTPCRSASTNPARGIRHASRYVCGSLLRVEGMRRAKKIKFKTTNTNTLRKTRAKPSSSSVGLTLHFATAAVAKKK